MKRLTERYTYNGKPEISVDSEISGISCSNFCTSCGKADCEDIRKALFKLAEYEDLEEQGKLLKLPCAVGDTVYVLDRDGKPREMILDAPDIRCHCSKEDNLCIVLCDKKNTGVCAYRFKNDGSDIGEKVFLTREEAEAALKEL